MNNLIKKFLILRKGFINELRGLSVAVGIIAGIVILGTIVALVVDQIGNSLPVQNANSTAWNITQLGLNTFSNIFEQAPLLGTILILLVIASAALGIFAFFGGGKQSF